MSAEESSPATPEARRAGMNAEAAGGSPSEHVEGKQPEAAAETPAPTSADAAWTDHDDEAGSAAKPADSEEPERGADPSQGHAGQAASAGGTDGSGNGRDGSGGGSVDGADSGSQAPAVPPKSEMAKPAAQPNKDDEAMAEDEASMSFTEHLGELRMRIVRMLLGATVGFLLCYGVAEDLFRYLSLPLVKVMPPDTRFIYTSVPEGFFVYLKIAFVAGVFVASPYIFYQLWAFIAPGLYKEERQHIVPLAFCSAIFFLLGAAFCYWGVFPFAFTFFMSYSTGMIVAMPSLNEYLGFALKMLLAFGLIFEMPLFAFFLSRLRIITPAWMRKVRRYAILAIFIVAAILTPPDVFSQLLMAGPMIVLYEVSIYVAAIARPRGGDTAKQAPSAGSSNV